MPEVFGEPYTVYGFDPAVHPKVVLGTDGLVACRITPIYNVLSERDIVEVVEHVAKSWWHGRSDGTHVEEKDWWYRANVIEGAPVDGVIAYPDGRLHWRSVTYRTTRAHRDVMNAALARLGRDRDTGPMWRWDD